MYNGTLGFHQFVHLGGGGFGLLIIFAVFVLAIASLTSRSEKNDRPSN